MKSLEITIGKKDGLWELDFICEYSPKAREIVMKILGRCRISVDGTLSSGMRTSNVLTLMRVQAELLSKAE